MLIAYPSDSPAPDIPSVPPTSIAPVSTSTPEEAIDWTVRHFADYLAGADLRKEWVCPADIDRFDPKAPFFSLPRFDEATKTPVTMSAQAVEIRGNQARATVKTIQWVEVDYQYSQGNIHLETGYFSRESGNSWQLCPSAEEAFR